MEILHNQKNIRDCAVTTLINIWTSIDWDKVDSKRAYGIWDEFSSKVKSSAMTTNSYEKFIEKLCRKFDIRSLKYRETDDIRQQDEKFKKDILKLFREETLGLVLEMKLNNQVRKEELEAKNKERENK